MTPEEFLVGLEFRAITPRPDCLLWFSNLSVDGYGRVGINGDRVRVHRLVYELKVGPIPDGMVIDHLCRVRCCVNPEHMEVVTHEVNAARAALLRGGPDPTQCLNGHPYTPENTATRRGYRMCRLCRRDQRARARARAKSRAEQTAD